MIKVSVIVPVYGVENHIKRCIESLLAQSYDNTEIIIVNDCTKDKSIEIIKSLLPKYPNKDVKLINHEKNFGLPTARNTGLASATGDYVLHFDGDDYAESRMITDLVSATNNGSIDIVYSDWYLTYSNNDRYMTQPKVQTPGEALLMMLNGKMKFNVWNKLVKRDFYNNGISFPDGYNMGEDMTMIKITALAKTINYIPNAYYHYVKTNSGAMTENMSEKSLMQIEHNVNSTVDFLLSKNISDEHSCHIFRLTVKYPLLFTYDTSNYKKWRSLFQESNEYIGDDIFGLHSKIIQWMAVKGMNNLLKLHYLVYNVIYKLIFK